MLILSRRPGESVKIGDEITVTVLDMKGNQLRLGFTAPRNVAVHREEVYKRLQRERPDKTLQLRAAASLTDVMRQISTDYQKAAHVGVKLSFDASSTLARQIEEGACADVFFSADTDSMDYLQERNFIQPATRKNLLGNALVLIAPAQSEINLAIAPHFALGAALNGGRLATGDPDSVPVGRYARVALKTLGVWDQVSSRIARAENVRTALMCVARGEAPLGIVYRSDALREKGVRVLDTFPTNTYPPIVYPVALTQSAQGGAAAFISYLASSQAQRVFAQDGFSFLVH
jgi:molybdate transport system substrate-binding protein